MTNNGKSDTISSSEFVKSLRGVGKRYPVRLDKNNTPFGQHYQLDMDNNITDVEVFAGKGTNKEIRNKRFLESKFNIPAKEWQKCSGIGYVVKNGYSVKAELHWYQADGKRTELKIKRWFDES